MFFGLPPEWLALIGTVIATVGVRLVERWLTKKDRNVSDAAQIRSELKDQVTSLREEIHRLEDEVDEWRGKYYAVTEELVAKRIALTEALGKVNQLTEQAAQQATAARKIIDKGLDTDPYL